MEDILDMLEGFIDMIMSLVDWVWFLINEVVYLVELLNSILANIGTYLGWMPLTMSSVIVLILGVVVIYKIMGREG